MTSIRFKVNFRTKINKRTFQNAILIISEKNVLNLINNMTVQHFYYNFSKGVLEK